MTTSVAPASAPPIVRGGATTARAPSPAAKARARSSVRLRIRSSGAPASRSAAATARAAPPAPRSAAGPRSARQPGTQSSRLAINPDPSVFSPHRLPSLRTTIVLTAPMRAARGAASSTRVRAASLVRHRDVDTGKPQPGQRAQRRFEVFGTYRQRHVGPIDAVVVEPKAVQSRRAGMRHRASRRRRPASCGRSASRGAPHAGTRPWPRRNSEPVAAAASRESPYDRPQSG